jgi:molybdate/tungstate transport system substrate-binding protein
MRRPLRPLPPGIPRGLALGCLLALAGCAPGPSREAGRLTVFNAGSLAAPFRDLLEAFRARQPELEIIQESAGSLESARKLTELGRIPDVLGVADYQVIPSLLIPGHATWYLGFARNAMVLAHTPRSAGADGISADSWWRVLLRPGIRVGRSDPALDPNGYRTLMVYQLAEKHYGQPGLAARLLAASPERFIRPKEADLVALLQAGELDYAWSYRSLAETMGLQYVSLPDAVDLSNPALAEAYAAAEVRVPGPTRGGDSVTFRGEPIVYGVTIPTAAPNPVAARAFVRFVVSPEGAAILRRHGFAIVDPPAVFGPGAPPAGMLPNPPPATPQPGGQS